LASTSSPAASLRRGLGFPRFASRTERETAESDDASVDFVAAFTVFSSIPEPTVAADLARDIRRIVDTWRCGKVV
jgi:hypothetical protein